MSRCRPLPPYRPPVPTAGADARCTPGDAPTGDVLRVYGPDDPDTDAQKYRELPYIGVLGADQV